eukprot:scaffold41364_cov67-Phaeocystis_antarctica.AAC.2
MATTKRWSAVTMVGTTVAIDRARVQARDSEQARERRRRVTALDMKSRRSKRRLGKFDSVRTQLVERVGAVTVEHEARRSATAHGHFGQIHEDSSFPPMSPVGTDTLNTRPRSREGVQAAMGDHL